MKFLYKFTDPKTWCVKCGITISIVWSILIAIIVTVTLYIERLEYSTLQCDELRDLNRIHATEIIIAHSILWLVGLFCTFGCMVMMRRSIAIQHRIEEELIQERNHAREYFDIAAVIMVVLDINGNIKLLNRKGYEILERVGEDIIGANWFDLCILADNIGVRSVFSKLSHGIPQEYYENKIVTKSGAERLVAWRNTVLYENGVCAGTLSSGLDITDQREVGDELRSSCDDLAEKNAELARFVYTVSHDLKSPLVTIKGYIGLLIDNINDGSYSEVQKNAMTINRAADKMRQLLDELLRLSKVGRVCGDHVCRPLNVIVSDVIFNINGICGGIEIIVQPDMPELCGDEIRLSELLQNLIENAIKYMGDQDNPRIEITASVEDNEIVCCVSDNGIGIEEAYLEKIFNLFEKLDPDVPGSGVGLAVAKRIVEVHHGRIWCESTGPGKGSRFYFSIPRENKSV